MNLRDYTWFNNVRGLVAHPTLSPERYIQAQLGWVKLHIHGLDHLTTVETLLEQQCMPIIQLEGVQDLPSVRVYDDIYQPYVEKGAFWFELLPPPNTGVGSHEDESLIAALMENWFCWAERLVAVGGYPAFPRLVASIEPAYATLHWANAMLTYAHENHRERFLYLVANGLWFAVDMRMENRFYQHRLNGPRHIPRKPTELNPAEPGWHFEHPYDSIQQRVDRGRTVLGGTENSTHGAPFGVIGTAQMMQDLLKKIFKVGPVPVIATQGGSLPLLTKKNKPVQAHAAYPPMDAPSQQRAIFAMVEWLVHRGPPWFFGVTLTNEHAYYDAHGRHPVIKAWEKRLPSIKTIPSVDTGGLSHAPDPLPYPDTRPDTEPIERRVDADILLADLDSAPIDGTIYEEDTLLDLLTVPEPAVLLPGEEPDPSIDIIEALRPITIILDRDDTEPIEPIIQDEKVGSAFFAMLDDYTELTDDMDDDATALDRFNWMITADGSESFILPDDEQEAPDFFDIVEEFTGERPKVSQPLQLERQKPATHFLFLGSPEWFTACHLYWSTFRPTIIHDTRLLEHVPDDGVLVITVITPDDDLVENLRSIAPHAVLDVITGDIKAELEWRVSLEKPFGDI